MEKPDKIQEWLENEGMQIMLTLMPRENELLGIGNEPVRSIDPSEVCIVTTLKSRSNTKTGGSKYVRATRKEIKKLALTQFEEQFEELLDAHFNNHETEEISG